MHVIMKTLSTPGYHRSGFGVTSRALGHMMHSYTFLVLMKQRVLSQSSKEYDISSRKKSTTHRVLKFHRSKLGVI